MNTKERDALKKGLEEIKKALADGTISEKDRQDYENLAAQTAGLLLHSWLPVDWGRRIIMLILFIVGLVGLFIGKYLLMLSWVILVIFSPRLVGEITYAFGRLFGQQRN